MSLAETLTLVIAGGSTAAGLATVGTALVEYRRQGRQKRAEQFFALREKLKGSEEFRRVAELLDIAASTQGQACDDANRELLATPFSIKRDYLGLFEDVALALNSGLVDLKVAHYMFGYYAILCRDSDAFWSDVNRLSPYWSVFNDFCDQLAAVSAEFAGGTFVFKRADYRF